LVESTVTNNELGIDVSGGAFNMIHSNLYDNPRNLKTTKPLIFTENFLGTVKPNLARMAGPVTVRSLLDAPWPGGAVINVDPENMAKKAQEEKEKGLAAFKKMRYGEAYEHLRASLDYVADREVMFPLTYVLNVTGNGAELEALLEKAYVTYPYDVRFYSIGIRYLLSKEKKTAAKKLWDRAIKLNPNDLKLKNLQFLVGG